jgi:hypothetical protein
MRITCDRCGKDRMVNEAHTAQRDLPIRDIIAKIRHYGGRAGRVELLTGIEGTSGRPVRRIVLREGSTGTDCTVEDEAMDLMQHSYTLQELEDAARELAAMRIAKKPDWIRHLHSLDGDDLTAEFNGVIATLIAAVWEHEKELLAAEQ